MPVSTPAISVVIPAFDAEETLGQQLDAFARQRGGLAFEVLVCDNGSSDGTAALVRERCAGEPWLRLVDASARRGPAAARNIGVRAARAELLAFCDADDVVADDWVAAMAAALRSDVFVTGSLDGALLNEGGARSISWVSEAVFRMPYMPWLGGASTNNMGVRRSAFEQAGGFCEELRTSEDTDLSWRIQLAGHRLVHHPEILLHVRKREGRRAVFLQGFHYGVGDELLRGRYADVIDALARDLGRPDGEGQPGAAPDAGTEPAEGGLRRRLARAARSVVRRRGRVLTADRIHLLGYWLGARRGRRLAPAMERLAVPDPLPRNTAG